jgi:hypothetical protein
MTPTTPFGMTPERLLLGDWGARLSGRSWQIMFLILALAGLLSYEAVSNQITETNVLHEDRVSLASYLNGTAAQPLYTVS